MRRRHLLLAPAVVAVSAAACGDDPARPEESPIDAVAGEYALVGWCGQPLPVETGTFGRFWPSKPVQCRIVMESGSLELDADGAYAMRHVQLHECDHTFTPERIEFHETGTFTVERKLLRILFVDVSGPDHRTAGIEGKRIVFLGPEDAERQLFEKAEPQAARKPP